MQPTTVHINHNEKLYGNIQFILHASLAAFITYLSMYAFRKPFTAATYHGLKLWSIDYKILFSRLLHPSRILAYQYLTFYF